MIPDDDLATVHGLLTADGLFDGTISTLLEDYHVEPVSRYIPTNTSGLNFHSIVYRASDVHRPSPSAPCASQLLHHARHNTSTVFNRTKRWMPEEENLPAPNHPHKKFPVIPDYPNDYPYDFTSHEANFNTSRKLRPHLYNPGVFLLPKDVTRNTVGSRPGDVETSLVLREPDEPYDSVNRPTTDDSSRSDNLISTEDPVFSARHVHKRATIDPKKTTCMLYLQADHLFYQKYGTEEACIEVMTRHVQRVNSIYKGTGERNTFVTKPGKTGVPRLRSTSLKLDIHYLSRQHFNQDGKPDNISFMIKRIKVHSMEALKDPTYRFPLNYGVEKFLELFSEEDYDAFCLAYMFTYRDFEMGTLGLAWTGDLKNAGGVCEKNGHYRGSMKSLNTGIVTLLNYGKHVPPAVSHVTLAHEIGHNFGSPHDPDLCTPGGEDGNFIMFARATSGDKKNNNHFSPCSLNSINPVLNSKARSPKGCFTEPQTALCGNGVVEVGEECDCGWEEDCRDDCCFPQRRYPPPEEPPCKLTPNSVCSPSQGPCCTPECQLKFGDKCRDDNGCRDSSFCDGRGPQCPPSVNKPNKTVCNEEFVCFMGECTGSICLAYGLESCQCIPGPKDTKTKACELCCKLPGEGQQCLSSFDWNSVPYDIPDMFSKPGTPCNDYNGYCDVFQKCREVDPSGPLATLRKLLLSDESIASFKRWISDHWYAVLLIVFAIIFVLVLSTKLLGKRPNPKLKSITIIHSSTTETVRLPPEGEGGQVTVHPAAVRSKLPLKRKVREAREKHRLTRHRAKNKDTSNNNNTTPIKTKKIINKKKKKKNAIIDGTQVNPNEAASKPATNVAEETALKRKLKKSKQQLKMKKKKKEVIDYSSAQGDKEKLGVVSPSDNGPIIASVDTDPVGKVKNWLLNSQQPQSRSIPKSKSTPVALTSPHVGTKSPTKPHAGRHKDEPPKSRSTGNLQSANKTAGISDKDKVRLQVVYKPPFKFSLKLRKPDKTSATSTNVVVDKSHRRSVPEVRKKPNGRGNGTRTALHSGAPKPIPPECKIHPQDTPERANALILSYT
uniref:ADAM10 endopeptidase n=1 Tax=Timema californicum TaxID=61474 RepID=A0A7R9P2S9_TIMCA|nr:unnamed protein product [Timema californicum]